MAIPTTESTEADEGWDVMSPILIFDALRHRQVEPVAAAIMAGAILVADTIRSLKAAT